MIEDQTTVAHYDAKWRDVISKMPQGGDYCFYMRQYGYDIIKEFVPRESKIFDFACGLGVLPGQLAREKHCLCYGVDMSPVAVEYARERNLVNASEGTGFFRARGVSEYDIVIATYFIEHIRNPVAWMREALSYGGAVIVSIPNNFSRAGEHVNMAWDSLESFYALFAEFQLNRLDVGRYHPYLPAAYHHPTFLIQKK